MKIESFLSFIAGACIGAAAVAVFLSSEESEDTRQAIRDLKSKAKDTFDSCKDNVARTTSQVVDNVSEAVHTAADIVDSAISTVKGV